MGEQTTMEPRERAAMADQTYVVVRSERLTDDSGNLWDVWTDVATVTVPARTQRKTVIEKALNDAGLVPPVGEQFEVRVLDADSSRTVTVGSVQPPPVLQIGEAS